MTMIYNKCVPGASVTVSEGAGSGVLMLGSGLFRCTTSPGIFGYTSLNRPLL